MGKCTPETNLLEILSLLAYIVSCFSLKLTLYLALHYILFKLNFILKLNFHFNPLPPRGSPLMSKQRGQFWPVWESKG